MFNNLLTIHLAIIIVVMNVTEHSPVSLDNVSDDHLKPYSAPKFVYVAAVLTSNEYDFLNNMLWAHLLLLSLKA